MKFHTHHDFSLVDYEELLITLQRLQKNLKSFGLNALVGRAQIAHNLLNRPSVANALDTRLQVLERRHPRVDNPLSYNAQKLTKDVSEILGNLGISNLILISIF